MNTGITYVEVNYDAQWIANAIANLQVFSWLYQWGMYLFLLATAAILFWIFFDSITKKKDQKALVPRILAIVGFFLIIPAFIFRYTGNADGVTTLVRLGAEPGTPYYVGAINWNVNWLVLGLGPVIAVIALIGMLASIAAIVIYASSVQRAKPSTEFVQAFNSKMANLEDKVEDARRSAAASNAGFAPQDNMANRSASAATIIDRKPQAATIIDVPQTGDMLTVQVGRDRGTVHNLPASDVVIGRDPQRSSIIIDDGKVSSEHAKLSYSGNAWLVFDMGSTNGTFLNGQRLVGQRQLANGDVIKIGDTVLVFSKAL